VIPISRHYGADSRESWIVDANVKSFRPPNHHMTLSRIVRRVVLSALVLVSPAAAQVLAGTAQFTAPPLAIPFKLDGAAAVPPPPTGPGSIEVPNPTPPPPTVPRTVQWFPTPVGGVTWFLIWRDGVLIGGVRLPAGAPGNAWLNDGSNGGAGRFGTW
jgi:hypothetical protein